MNVFEKYDVLTTVLFCEFARQKQRVSLKG